MNKESVEDRIRRILSEHPVVLFLNGTPDRPADDLSGRMIGILNAALAPDFFAVNVGEDPELLQGVKDYSQWPAIPVLFVKGDMVGGCDIVHSLYSSGDLKELLKAS